jgi:molybdenum storage protein
MAKTLAPLYIRKSKLSETDKIKELTNYLSSSLEAGQANYKGDLKIYPDVKMIKIGGQSITDRGRSAMFPILDEIVENKDKHQIMISSGGGTRARHTYHIGIDLGMPIGVMAEMGGSITVQNARMIQMLLAKHGGIYVDTLEFDKIPLFLRMGCIPIMPGMPPYSFWEDIPDHGNIPMNRTDTGVFFVGESLGVETIYFIKDEEGLYTDDPKKNPKARFIPKIHVEELREMDLNDLVVERVVLDYMVKAQNVKKLHIFNGLKKGNITKALDGEEVGTIIYKD